MFQTTNQNIFEWGNCSDGNHWASGIRLFGCDPVRSGEADLETETWNKPYPAVPLWSAPRWIHFDDLWDFPANQLGFDYQISQACLGMNFWVPILVAVWHWKRQQELMSFGHPGLWVLSGAHHGKDPTTCPYWRHSFHPQHVCFAHGFKTISALEKRWNLHYCRHSAWRTRVAPQRILGCQGLADRNNPRSCRFCIVEVRLANSSIRTWCQFLKGECAWKKHIHNTLRSEQILTFNPLEPSTTFTLESAEVLWRIQNLPFRSSGGSLMVSLQIKGFEYWITTY